MQENNTNLSISPSGSNPQLTAVIPRLLPGELLARHVATLKAEDALTCGWCGEPFLEGQEWMLDVYQQDGDSDTPIKALGKPQVFKKTAVLMVHASDCLLQSCTKAVSDFTERVCFSQRKALIMSEDDMRTVVWKQFRWAVRWISWHHQYLIHDPIDMVLGSRRPLLTEGVCPSFVLEMTKSHKYGETVHRVKAPMQLIAREFIEALHTRVFEYEMIYKGKYQPILQLKSVFEKSAFNTKLNDANVAAYVHTVVQGSYSSRHADEQHLKLIVKVRPSALHMARLMAIYEAMCEDVTWVMLHEHAQATKPDKPAARRGDGSDEDDDEDADDGDGSEALLTALLGEMQQSCSQSESEVNRALTSAGMQVNKNGKHRAYTTVSTVSLAQDNGHRTSIACSSNCYMGSKAARAYYFFRHNHGDSEQPLFCYEGVMPGVVPMVISSAVQLAEEMKEAALQRKELLGLTVLLAHHKTGERLRAAKSD